MILVTGSTGFIGGHLIRHLIRQKQRLRILIRKESQFEKIGKSIFIEPFYGDLRDLSTLNGVMRDVDVIFHLAGIINAEKEQEKYYWNTNVQGTRNLLISLKREKRQLKRFVFCSSVGVMGKLKSIPADEDTLCVPHNLYEKSKYEAEKIVRDFHKREGMPSSIVRPSWVYGPGDKRTLKLFHAINKKRFIIIGDGKANIHPVYVKDVVRGLILCASAAKAEGQTYIIAGKKALPLRELVNIIAEECYTLVPNIYIPIWIAQMIAIIFGIIFRPFPMKPPLSQRRLEFFIKDQSFDISKAQNEIGFNPMFTLHQGIKQTVQWYKDHNYL